MQGRSLQNSLLASADRNNKKTEWASVFKKKGASRTVAVTHKNRCDEPLEEVYSMKTKKSTLFIFLGPAFLLYMFVFLYPTVRTTAMSLFQMSNVTTPISQWSFVGLDNFTKLFSTPLFRISMINIAKIWLFCGIAALGLAFLFAVLLVGGIKGKGIYRTIIYLPNVISGIAIGYMWLLYVFNNKFGLLAKVFHAIGLKGLAEIPWTSPSYIFTAMCVAYVFSSVGYYMLTYMAAIEGIPEDFYEAARLEGANRLHEMIYITFPLIASTVKSSLTLWSNKVIGFFALSLVFGGATTITPMVYTYNALFGTEVSVESNAGVAASSAVVMTVIIIILFVATNLLVKDKKYEY